MRRVLVILILISLGLLNVNAQKFYHISVSSQPYEELENPIVLQQSPFPNIEQVFTISPGFSIDFFGEDRHIIEVWRRGEVAFSPREYIRAINNWDGFVDRGNTKLLYELDTSICDNYVVKIEFQNIGFKCDTLGADSINYQIWLYQNGTIKMHYGDRNINPSQNSSCSFSNHYVRHPIIKSTFKDDYFYKLSGNAQEPNIDCHHCKKDTAFNLYNVPPKGTLYTFTVNKPSPPLISYNNPFSNELRINYNGCTKKFSPYTVTFYNMQGKELSKLTLTQSINSINTSLLPSGVIVMVICNQQNEIIIKKLIMKI